MQSALALPEDSREDCANCGAALVGPYCAACGQNAEAIKRPAWALIEHTLESLFDFDGRGVRTLGLLLTRPGRLTRLYLAGKRASLVPPVRLYLFVSLVFFVTMWATGTAIVQFGNTVRHSGDRVVYLKVFAPLDRTPTTIPADAIHADGDVPAWVEHIFVSIQHALAEPKLLNERLYELFPKMMFALVPVFALVLWVLYARAHRYLIEHLVFALHIHSFIYILGTVLIVVRPLLPSPAVNVVFPLAAAIYLLVAMRVVYAQGWLRTGLKEIALVLVYYLVFGVGLVGLVVTGVGEF